MSERLRTSHSIWLLGWMLALGFLGFYVWSSLRISGDLRLFLPPPRTPAQELLIEGIEEGAAQRLLLVGLAGSSSEELAEYSRRLAGLLRARNEFVRVENGDSSLASIPDDLLPYRYLLSTTLDTGHLNADSLARELRARLKDLASPAAPLLEPLLPRDPTLEVLTLAEYWRPVYEPARVDGVWFAPRGDQALLLIETAAPGFDPDAQQQALNALQSAFAELTSENANLRLTVGGPGSISAIMKERTQAEAERFGTAATAGLMLMLVLAYRRVRVILIGAMPLVSAALAGLASVTLIFGEVHGVTLAFGFTLLGVAQDYPMHLVSHQHGEIDPMRNAKAVWPTMRTGVLSTCIAFAAFLVSDVSGLRQLGVFTIAGLLSAAVCTRQLLPRIMGMDYRDNGRTSEMRMLWGLASRIPKPWWSGPLLLGMSLMALLLGRGELWDDDLTRLTPVPQELIKRDLALRSSLGAPDVRFLVGIRGPSAEGVLSRLESLDPILRAAIDDGLIDGFDHAARYLPSEAVQRRRQAALPDEAALRSALRSALSGLPFRPGIFEPFVADVVAARSLVPLTPEKLTGTPLAGPVDALLHNLGGEWVATVTLAGVRDVDGLREMMDESRTGAVLADLKDASTTLIAEQRVRVLWTLGLSVLLLMGVVRLVLGDWRRSWSVLMPMSLTTIVVVAVLHAAGQPLNVFHLISLVLAAGLGLDYALFFERPTQDLHERRRTLHGVLVCAASTFMVFALLSISSIPVLQSIGVTVALGVLSNFVLALLYSRGSSGDAGCGSPNR